MSLSELENKYIEMFDDIFNIFPDMWFDIDDDKSKIKVLELAIKEHKRIIDVKGGEKFVEGII